MPTLLTVGNSEGTRRCDAKCYDATEPACDCVCGGKNHGAGLQRALDNTREMAEGWVREIAAREGRDVSELNVELFGKPALTRDMFAAYRWTEKK